MTARLLPLARAARERGLTRRRLRCAIEEGDLTGHQIGAWLRVSLADVPELRVELQARELRLTVNRKGNYFLWPVPLTDHLDAAEKAEMQALRARGAPFCVQEALAMAHTLRPQEARAIDLLHWNAPDMLIQQALKGRSATAEIRGLKEDDWRVVSADEELEAWIRWRIERAAPEERLRQIGVPLFPNPKGKNSRRWSHHALDREWRRAMARAFPTNTPNVPLYAGTKHSTATDLMRRPGVSREMLQRFFGHADPRSTDGYVVLADEFKGLVRGKDR